MRNMRPVISIGAAFIVGSCAGWVAKGKYLDFLFSHYVPALVTLLAAFYGAKFAFNLQAKKEAQEKRNREIINGNLAIFKLTIMLNHLLQYQKQFIDPFRGSQTAFVEMTPSATIEKKNTHIDLDSLSFLLVSDNQNVIGEVLVEEERYDAAITAIKSRSATHINELQPCFDNAGFENGGSYSMIDIKAILGERLFHTLVQSTDQVINHVDLTINSIQEVARKLNNSLKKQFPDERIFSIEIPQIAEQASKELV
jgi:hypothetical protein